MLGIGALCIVLLLGGCGGGDNPTAPLPRATRKHRRRDSGGLHHDALRAGTLTAVRPALSEPPTIVHPV